MCEKLESKLREDFKQTLYELSSFDGRGPEDIDDKEMCLEIYEKFDRLYKSFSHDGEEFKYYDSDIFIVVSSVNNMTYQGNIVNAISKIQRLLEYIHNNKFEHEHLFEDSVVKQIKKLYDCLNLENSRIEYMYSMVRNQDPFGLQVIRTEISNIMNSVNGSSEKLESLWFKTKNLDANAKKIEKRVQRYQKEYVAILSIFASVLLSFISGITFSSSVLSNINNMNIWIGISVISLLGLVLVNILFILFSFILKIVYDESNFIKCKYYVVFNLVMLIILIISLVIYFNGSGISMWLLA